MEVIHAPGPGTPQHGGYKGLPELRVDMPRGVNPKAIHSKAIDPGAINIDETLHHARVLRHEVIEPNEVPELRGFSLESRVTAVVVVDGIVQPSGHFDVLLCLGYVRRIGVV